MLQVLTALGSIASQWLSNKSEKSKAKHDKELEVIQQVGTWDELHAKNSGNSWKDEWFTILFSIPLIMCFVPHLVPYVEQGFAVLETMPDWYKGFLGAAVAASFGIRSLTNFKGK
tara:strand:- start:751 stop:1095 length:345 start_codon:yes stop_codon:yes gene_type:complete